MNCLITGASIGIGHSLALKLASLGYNLLLTYYSNDILCSNLKKEIEEKYKVKCIIKKCDLKNEQEIRDVVLTFKNELGKMDILVNNASYSSDNLFMEKTKQEFMDVLEVNLIGTFLISQYSIPIMNKQGIIINMASTDGIDTYSIYNTDYAVSKAGIIQLTKSMSLIFNDLKTVAIAPNWVSTESTLSMNQEYLEEELKRIGQKKLIDIEKVVDNIIKVINDNNVRSGEVIKIYD